MITNTDLTISNKSYTNSDFESLYTELLDLCTKISSRFDPTLSNESDPFITMLKLMAMSGDKLNYNVDKNILERFITSATQETSVSDLCEMLGYYRHYYQAAEASIVFISSTTVSSSSSSTSNKVTIPQYTVMGDGDNDEYTYVLCENAYILNGQTKSTAIKALQGVKNVLTVLDSSTNSSSTSITTSNLDENNRIYFPVSNVAENGIFINDILSYSSEEENDNEGAWKRSKNLNLESYNTNVFKFGYDSKEQLPYIEFPSWAANIFDDGITITYIVTNGSEGAVSAGMLTTTISDSDFTDDDGTSYAVNCSNSSSSTAGADPETINESYNGFKKTIGTFDTLVTCLDYANYIYNELYEDGTPLVSNVHVSDRRTDLNYGGNVLTYTTYGTQVIPMYDEENITPYDLCVYPLKAVSDTTFNSLNATTNFNTTFTADLNGTTSGDSYVISSDLEDTLESKKTISHNYKAFKENDVVAVKNYLKLSANLSTIYKVNTNEQLDILDNVRQALQQQYNARKLDFGEEIPFESLLKTIQSSDTRISSVSLYEPELTTYILNAGGEEVLAQDTKKGITSDTFKSILAKNVLSGKASLYEYNNTFDFKYGQVNGSLLTEDKDKITNFSSYANIAISEGETSYKLKSNEVIQFIAPNFITKVKYPYGINIAFHSKDAWSSKDSNFTYTTIEANHKYRLYPRSSVLTNTNFTSVMSDLSNDDYLLVNYTNSDSQVLMIVYYNYLDSNGDIFGRTMRYTDGKFTSIDNDILKGIILYPSVMLKDVKRYSNKEDKSVGTPITKEVNGVSYYFDSMGVQDTLDIQYISGARYTTSKYICWYLNNKTSIPFTLNEDRYEYLLEDDEYLFIISSDQQSLNAYGSGTTISIPKDALSLYNYSIDLSSLNINDILEGGTSALMDYAKPLKLTSTLYLDIQENTIISLANGSTLMSASAMKISNNIFKDINANDISYTLSDADSSEILPVLDITDINWQARALVDLNVSASVNQSVPSGSKQVIVFNHIKDNVRTTKLVIGDVSNLRTEDSVELTEGYITNESFCLDNSYSLGGGVDVDLGISTVISSSSGVSIISKAYPSCYSFDVDLLQNNLLNSNGYNEYSVNFSYVSSDNASSEYETPYITFTGGKNLGSNYQKLMIFASGISSSHIYLQIDGTDYKASFECNKINIVDLDSVEFESSSSSKKLSLEDKTIKLNILREFSTTAVQISNLANIIGENPELGLLENDTSLESYIKENLPTYWEKFYSIGFINANKDKKIDISDSYPLSSPYIFYDINNEAHDWTISQIDFSSSKIRVANSSRSIN